jgi:hypothetical protein
MPALNKAVPLPTEGDPTYAPAVATFGDDPFKVTTIGRDPNIRGSRKMTKDEAWTHARRREQEANFGYSGVAKPCVVVNFNPFPLFVNGGMLFNTQIPACPVEKPYVFAVLKETKWTTQDQGVGLDNIAHFYPWPTHPAEQATEYLRAYNEEQMAGGVVIFFGESVPADLDIEVEVPVIRTTDDEFATNRIERTRRNLKEMWDEALGKRNRSMLGRLQRAMSNYSNDNTRHLVNDNDRQDAHMAVAMSLIKELPPFCMAVDLEGAGIQAACKDCGTVPLKSATVCVHCGGIFDPVKAYINGRIEFGHVCMDAMNEEQWDAVLKEKQRRLKIRDRLIKAKKIVESDSDGTEPEGTA